MELIEIKEILRKASIEVDIQGHGKHVALFETDFERVAIELVKKLTIPVVVGRSEQLKCGCIKDPLGSGTVLRCCDDCVKSGKW